MNLRAFSDGCRLWIEDPDVSRDDPGAIIVRFRVPHDSGGAIPKRAEKRILAIAETMAAAANKAHPDHE